MMINFKGNVRYNFFTSLTLSKPVGDNFVNPHLKLIMVNIYFIDKIHTKTLARV